MPKLITGVGCPYCGSSCDDLEVLVSDDETKVLEVRNSCIIGSNLFHHANDPTRPKLPRMRQPDGSMKEIPYEEAIDWMAKTMLAAKKPLIYGFGSTNCEGMSAVGRIAEKSGAVLDNCATICHGPSFLAIFDNGYPSCTLGEAKNRADVVVFWGCNPMHAHPRHTSRYSIFPRGYFTQKGQMQRTVLSIDPRETDTAKLADVHLMLDQGHDYELFDAMRTVLRGHEIPDTVAGIDKETIIKSVEIMKKARFCMIFFGMGCTHSDGRNHNVDIAISLTRDLNEHTKASIMAMRGHYNIAGPGQVWSWQFGFPYCIDLSKGTHAHMNPGETSSVDLAMRDEVDCFVNVGADAGAHFPIQAVQHLKKHPFITIDPNFNMASEVSDLHIPVRIAGVDEPGVVYRMDNVPIQFKAVLKGLPGVPSDEQLFDQVYERMCELTKTEPVWLAAKEDRKYPHNSNPVVS